MSPSRAIVTLRVPRVEELIGLRHRRRHLRRAARAARLRRTRGATGEEIRADRAARALRGREARGRPGRGGRAPRRPRHRAALDAARPSPERIGAPQPRAAAAPPRRGRAARTSAPTRSSAGASPTGRSPTACGCPRGTRAATLIELVEPALGRAVGAAADCCSGACSTPPGSTSRAGADARGPVRVGPRLPARGCRRGRGAAGRRVRGRSPRARPRAAPDRPTWRPASRRRGLARAASRAPDFFTAKGVLEALSRAARGRSSRSSRPSEPFLHPGRQRGRSPSAASGAGWIGEVHPLVGADLGPRGRGRASSSTWRRWSPRRTAGREAYRDVTTFPPVHEDVAVVVPEDVPALGRPRGRDRGRRASCSHSAEVFDLYRGEQVGEGSKSLALRLAFRAPDRTLTDEEVGERREQITRGACRDRRVAP